MELKLLVNNRGTLEIKLAVDVATISRGKLPETKFVVCVRAFCELNIIYNLFWDMVCNNSYVSRM